MTRRVKSSLIFPVLLSLMVLLGVGMMAWKVLGAPGPVRAYFVWQRERPDVVPGCSGEKIAYADIVKRPEGDFSSDEAGCRAAARALWTSPDIAERKAFIKRACERIIDPGGIEQSTGNVGSFQEATVWQGGSAPFCDAAVFFKCCPGG